MTKISKTHVFVTIIIVVLLLVVVGVAQAEQPNPKKVAVCHCQPLKGCHTIWIAEEAVEAHLKQNSDSYLGECVSDPDPEPTPWPYILYLPIVYDSPCCCCPPWCVVFPFGE